MEKINTYIIKLKPKGSFSKFPDSNTIFGSICWAIRDFGDDLETFLIEFKERPKFILSDTFLYKELKEKEVYLFPKPSNSNIDKKIIEDIAIKFKDDLIELDEIKKLFKNIDLQEKAIKLFIVNCQKKYKKLKMMDSDAFFGIINNTWDEKELFEDYVLQEIDNIKRKIEKKKEIKIEYLSGNMNKNEDLGLIHSTVQRNNIDRISMTVSDDGGTFYEETFNIDKGGLYFIIKTNEIEKVFNYINYSAQRGFGKKKSIGRGQFDAELIKNHKILDQIIENKKKKSEYKVNLSNYIPLDKEIDFNNSSYELNINRKIVENRIKGSQDGFRKANTINLKSGSILKVNSEKEFYGDLFTVKKIEEKTIYENGYGFFLNVLNGGEENE